MRGGAARGHCCRLVLPATRWERGQAGCLTKCDGQLCVEQWAWPAGRAWAGSPEGAAGGPVASPAVPACLAWAAVDRFLLLLSSHGWSPHEGHEHEFGAYCTQCFEDCMMPQRVITCGCGKGRGCCLAGSWPLPCEGGDSDADDSYCVSHRPHDYCTAASGAPSFPRTLSLWRLCCLISSCCKLKNIDLEVSREPR